MNFQNNQINQFNRGSDKMNKVPNVQVSDTTGDATRNKSRQQKNKTQKEDNNKIKVTRIIIVNHRFINHWLPLRENFKNR